ncbi:MAG: hypothetical protein JWN43_3932, partial [Gammaproteobacteria bacterium]|nr:hypothetical protein [Gammaproteobacteria bacterium]
MSITAKSKHRAPAAPGDTLLSHSPLSHTDRAIITHLQEDGRRSFVAIAQDLGLSEKTVRTRVHQLLDSKIIQITALTSPVAMGYHAGALVGVTTVPSVPPSQIARELSRIRDVDYVVTSAGRYNLMVEVISRDLPALQRVVESEIGRIEGIVAIELFP